MTTKMFTFLVCLSTSALYASTTRYQCFPKGRSGGCVRALSNSSATIELDHEHRTIKVYGYKISPDGFEVIKVIPFPRNRIQVIFAKDSYSVPFSETAENSFETYGNQETKCDSNFQFQIKKNKLFIFDHGIKEASCKQVAD